MMAAVLQAQAGALARRTSKVTSAAEAVAHIRDGSTVVVAGISGSGHPETLSRACEERFLATGHPCRLTLMHAAGNGDRAKRGLNHFGYAGLTEAVIGAHWRTATRLTALIEGNQVAAWNLPQGVISQLFWAAASGTPGVISRVGLHTYVDPRHDAACMNDAARALHAAGQGRVEAITIRGEELLYYPGVKIDCALIRATSADADGNLSFEHETCQHDALAMAAAAHNSGGIVIVQVKSMVEHHADAHAVRVPGIYVDYIVCIGDQAEHAMTFGEHFNPSYLGTWREHHRHAVTAHKAESPPGAREIIQRRAMLEILRCKARVVNLGVGIPAGLARQSSTLLADVMFSVESGTLGGSPVEGLSFGATIHPVASFDSSSTFAFYDGGGLDIACLGVGEFDGEGNVNVSRFGEGGDVILAGSGGFINITQGTRRLLFLGTFRAGGLKVSVSEDGRLCIDQEGRMAKLVNKVSHLSFNGPYAERCGSAVMFVTERAVFELRHGRLVLVEIAPGIDLQRDILDGMEGSIEVAADLQSMPAEIFQAGPFVPVLPVLPGAANAAERGEAAT